MGFKYYNDGKWMRKGIGSFFTALLTLVVFVITSYSKESQSIVVFLLAVTACTIQVLGGIYYINLPDKDYIRIDDYAISIYRGLVIPRKKIPFDNIKKVVEVSTVIELKLKDDEQTLYPELLAAKDVEVLKEKLKKKTNWGNAHVN